MRPMPGTSIKQRTFWFADGYAYIVYPRLATFFGPQGSGCKDCCVSGRQGCATTDPDTVGSKKNCRETAAP